MFVIYVVIQKQEKMAVHSKKQVHIGVKAQIKAQIGVFIFDEALIIVSAKYSNYNNVFLAKNAAKLPECTKSNIF